MTKPSLKSWLLSQHRRDDVVGDLARDVRQDPSFPKGTVGNLTLRLYLRDHGACYGAVSALSTAWKEWTNLETP